MISSTILPRHLYLALLLFATTTTAEASTRTVAEARTTRPTTTTTTTISTNSLRTTAARPPYARSLDFIAGHLQSGPDSQGSSYASAGVVDVKSQTLHIVGTTYGKFWIDSDSGNSQASSGTDDPACFYAVANLPGGDNESTMDWIHSELLGSAAVEEGCLNLFLDVANQRSILIGHSDVYNGQTNQVDGLLGQFYNPGGLSAEDLVKAGMVLEYSFGSSLTGPTTENPLILHGGYLNQLSAVNYPVAVAGRLPDATEIYVAAMHSDYSSPNAEWEDDAQLDQAKYFRLGHSYFMTIGRYTIDGDQSKPPAAGETLHRSIAYAKEQSFAIAGATVHVAALLQLSDRLLVAGHTTGVGKGFGLADIADTPVGETLDGFVTQLDLTTLAPLTSDGEVPTHRITSGRDDFVTGMCYSESTPQYVYVTGASEGHVKDPNLNADTDNDTLWGYVRKLDLETMTDVWTQEFSATPATTATDNQVRVEAISCVLTPDGNTLYVAGNVYDGAGMNLTFQEAVPGSSLSETSAGGTDIWVAQIRAEVDTTMDDEQGDIVFLRQMGSAQDDTVAHRGGIQVDKFGNAVIIGNTQGEMYRIRADTEATGANARADVFLAMFELESGEFMLPLEHPDYISLPPNPAPVPPIPTPPGAPSPAPQTEGDNNNSGGINSILPDNVASAGPWVGMLIILVLGILIVVLGIVYWNCYHIPKRDIATDRSKVLDYLHDFDVEDVELKHSATGGWHCSYVNDLAQGVNHQSSRHLEHTSGEGLYSHGSASASAYDPLTAGGGSGRRFHRRGSGSSTRSSRSMRSLEAFIDDEFHADGEGAGGGSGLLDDAVITFGTARESRRERRSNYEGLLSGLNRDSDHSSSRRARRTASSSGASVSSTGSSSRRINRARERWENREVI
ncbi:hypothetical protein ACA910_005632 [Epithemia clementina (nom. ined.)]